MSLEGKSPEEIAALASLALDLSSNAKTRDGFLRLTKAANPSAHIPEVDIPAQMMGQFKPHLDRLEQLEKQASDRAMQDRIKDQRREALRSVKGVTRDDLPAIEKLMVERGIPDHKTAAEFYALQNKAAEPTPGAMQANRTLGAPKMPDLKEFGGNMQAWSRRAAHDAIDEMRGRRAT